MDRTSGQTPGQAELSAQYFFKNSTTGKQRRNIGGWKKKKSTIFNNNNYSGVRGVLTVEQKVRFLIVSQLANCATG